jgi:putative photosynthetic complex assembly protein 2
MLTEIWITAVFAMFIWWFSTGVILLVVRRADVLGGPAPAKATLFGLPLLAIGLAFVWISSTGADVLSVYLAFLGALAIWGWIELAFLTGVITGPEKQDCPVGLQGRARFGRAWWTVAYHELTLLAGLVVVELLTRGSDNDVAFWAYAILFIARILAKLNVFFGIPRINTEFVPRPLAHLTSYFRRGPITAMFPLAITILSFGMACFLQRLWVAETDPAIVAATLLTTLSGLALLEHWLMVVPLPDAKLWRWMLPAPADMTSEERKTNGL